MKNNGEMNWKEIFGEQHRLEATMARNRKAISYYMHQSIQEENLEELRRHRAEVLHSLKGPI